MVDARSTLPTDRTLKLRLLAISAIATLFVACEDNASPFFYDPDATTLDDADTTGAPDLGADVDPDEGLADMGSDSGSDVAEPDSEPTDVPESDTPGPDAPEPDVEPDAPDPDAPEPDGPEPDVEPDVPEGPVCGDDFFSGQAFEDPDAPEWSADGGSRADAPYPASYNSGLRDVIAAAPFDPDPADVEAPAPVPIAVDVIEATVFATAPNTSEFVGAQRRFWLHDGQAQIQVFLSDEAPEGWPDFDIHVGQRISFVANLVGSYRGVPQIFEGSGWRVASSGNPVAFWEIGNERIDFDDVPRNVRMTGEIVADLGPCGGSSTCYEFVYESQTVTFRTAADWINVGDCVAWAGPIGTFGGFPQLDGSNYRWFFDYGPTP